MFKLTSAQETQGKKKQQQKNGKLASPFFPPLTVKSCLNFFSLLGPLYGYIASERTKCEKGQNCPSPLCLLYMLYFKRKWYSSKFIAKWHVVYWLGPKAVDWNIRKKLFLVSLLAQLILMNMLRLNALILKNSSFWR